jgi:hypothetical protein
MAKPSRYFKLFLTEPTFFALILLFTLRVGGFKGIRTRGVKTNSTNKG